MFGIFFAKLYFKNNNKTESNENSKKTEKQ